MVGQLTLLKVFDFPRWGKDRSKLALTTQLYQTASDSVGKPDFLTLYAYYFTLLLLMEVLLFDLSVYAIVMILRLRIYLLITWMPLLKPLTLTLLLYEVVLLMSEHKAEKLLHSMSAPGPCLWFLFQHLVSTSELQPCGGHREAF